MDFPVNFLPAKVRISCLCVDSDPSHHSPPLLHHRPARFTSLWLGNAHEITCISDLQRNVLHFGRCTGQPIIPNGTPTHRQQWRIFTLAKPYSATAPCGLVQSNKKKGQGLLSQCFLCVGDPNKMNGLPHL